MEMNKTKHRAKITADGQQHGKQKPTTSVTQKHRAKLITNPDNISDAIDLAVKNKKQSFSYNGKTYIMQYVGNVASQDLQAIEEPTTDLSSQWFQQEMAKRCPINFCCTQ